LLRLLEGKLGLFQAFQRVCERLPRWESPHRHNNRVFCDRWEERLVRTQLSRIYNQAVLEQIVAAGEPLCFVPHSSAEDVDGQCALQLAGRTHDAAAMLQALIDCYMNGRWSDDYKIPEHPDRSHVV
jgi:hypothetical protein